MGSSIDPKLRHALSVVAQGFAAGSLQAALDGDERQGSGEETPIARMDAESGEVLGEAALAVAFGAFAARGGDGGPIHTLVASIGLLAMMAGEEPDPPAEIAAVLTDGDRVEAEIERAGDLADEAYRESRSGDDAIAALEARIVGPAITLAGCTLSDREEGEEAVRARAARYLARLSAGLLLMNRAVREGNAASRSAARATEGGRAATLPS